MPTGTSLEQSPSDHHCEDDECNKRQSELRGWVQSPPNPTLLHALHENAKSNNKDTNFLHWVDENGNVIDSVSPRTLWSTTAALAEKLLKLKINKGDRVMIAYPFGLEFLVGAAGAWRSSRFSPRWFRTTRTLRGTQTDDEYRYQFFACMRVGAIPCSVYPPNPNKNKAKYSFGQFNNQVKDAGAKFALTTSAFKLLMQTKAVLGHPKRVTWIATDKLRSPSNPDIGVDAFPKPEDIAFIQYSSGSTGVPKGIVISHKAVVHNLCVCRELIRNPQSPDYNVGVAWLPQYHDYALIKFVILSAFFPSYPCYMTSPIDFIRNPLLWADMMDKFQPTWTGGPNFSYSLLAKRMEAAGRRICNPRLYSANLAAEPIDPTTFDKMIEIGIPRHAISTSYGFAESCVAVTGCLGDDITVVDGVVCSGKISWSETANKHIVTADKQGSVLTDGGAGEICVRGPDLADGYWGRSEATKRAFRYKLDDGNEYFRSGDLGRIIEGKLFVVGRVKELIIINGKNIYPTDLERTLEAEYPNVVRPGSTVAYQHTDSDAGIVFELRSSNDKKAFDSVLTYESVRKLIRDAHGLELGAITMLRQGTVLKTTSGKLRRVETRKICMACAWGQTSVVWSWTKVRDAPNAILSSTNPPTRNGNSSCCLVDLKSNLDDIDALFADVMGKDFDPEKDWDSNGLSSLGEAELASQVDVKLPSTYRTLFPTPSDLKAFIKLQAGKSFPVKLPKLRIVGQTRLPVGLVMLLQGLGIVLHVTFVAISAGVAFLVGKPLVPLSIAVNIGSGRSVSWAWLQVVLPAFTITLTVITIIAKWIVVGRYRSEEIKLYSFAYIRWWFVDRLIHLWEMWVGRYILGTPFIWLAYRLMGASIHLRTDIKDFVREFDLVKIGHDTTIEQKIICRRFGPWKDDSNPSIRFRPVVIGEGCLLEGTPTLGCSVSDGVHLQKMSVLQEGAQVASGLRAEGDPAYEAAPNDSNKPAVVSYMMLLLRTTFLFVELYIFFVLVLVSNVIWNARFPEDWRYERLWYWISLLLTTSILSLLVSAAMKWSFIGHRTTEQRLNPTFRTKLADWVCDYHFKVSSSLVNTAFGTSIVWNGIFMLHGLNVDFRSGFADIYSFVPSVVDQLKVRRSFFSAWITFRKGEPIEIVDSTIGLQGIVGPGFKIYRSYLRTFSEATESMYDTGTHCTSISVLQIVLKEILGLLWFVTVCFSFIPAFEVFQATVTPQPFGLALPGTALSVLVQCIVWTLMARVWQMISLALQTDLLVKSKVFPYVYQMYLRTVWGCNDWGQWFVLWGTPYYNILARFMGSTIKGDFLFNGRVQHDFHALVFEDKTIVDDSVVNGHYGIGTELRVGQSIHAGVLHPGCFTVAGAVIDGPPTTETGPWRAVLGARPRKVVETAKGAHDETTENSDVSGHKMQKDPITTSSLDGLTIGWGNEDNSNERGNRTDDTVESSEGDS